MVANGSEHKKGCCGCLNEAENPVTIGDPALRAGASIGALEITSQSGTWAAFAPSATLKNCFTVPPSFPSWGTEGQGVSGEAG